MFQLLRFFTFKWPDGHESEYSEGFWKEDVAYL